MQFTDVSRTLTKELPSEVKKLHGIFLTPKSIRDRVWSLVPSARRILEPSCGTGEFILDALERFPEAIVHGVELNDRLAASIEPHERLKVTHGDFLEYREGSYDLIIGNPPYAVTKRKQPECMKGRGNLFCLFLWKCLSSHLNPDGILAFVLPTSFLNSVYYEPCRAYIKANHTVLALEPAVGKYLETTQDTMILVVQNRRSVSPYFFGTNLSYNASELAELCRTAVGTLTSLGFEVRTGSVVWNEHKNELSDSEEDTFLCYAHNIVGHRVQPMPQRGEKKQYIKRPGRSGPVILVVRGYGNSIALQYALCELPNVIAENHVNVVRPVTPEAAERIPLVLRSLADERSRAYLSYVCGNGALSASELAAFPVFEK